MVREMLRYRGSLEGAYDLVDELRAEGIVVVWDSVPEERTSVQQPVTVVLGISGAEQDLREAVARARRARPAAEHIELPDPPSGPDAVA